ncbi:hypothetical protein Phum_PHUM218760 [Pediculus humanus corporis]|uniref:Uncharacterized protein n=1 Tax=Pediculus humanus subsp. corporis TaxID=121224 RepID=E0VI05_PEDHC|nr:uncharacterized protein Phum_PHUM218760 [Pediculus humanus corporis]EEB13011.1 hypothetical protein Phum_PHUM218760 [Pediculus humanus corporis]
MGCASSAALPFLTTKGNQNEGLETTSVNGKQHAYDLQSINNELNENVKNGSESYISEKIKGVVDSSAVQGVIGNVEKTKEEIYSQVKGLKEYQVTKSV